MRKLTAMLSTHSHNKPSLSSSLSSSSAAAAANTTTTTSTSGIVGDTLSAEMESQLLRTLATLCSVEDSVLQLHQVNLCYLNE